VWTRTRHPSPSLECGEIERPVLTAHRFRTSSPHGDDLLETPHLRASGGTEEIDVADALVILAEPRQLVLDPRAVRRRLLLEFLQDLAVARSELPIVQIAGLVEQAKHIILTDVLDLLDPDQRRLSALALDLLGEPLKILVPLRRIGQEVGGAFERHRTERSQSTPDAHAETRRVRRKPDQQEEKR